MRTRSFGFLVTLLGTLSALPLLPADVVGQAQAAQTTKSWTPARTPDGQPTVQGDYGPDPTGTYDITDPRTGGSRLDEIIKEQSGVARARKPSRVIDPPDGKIPYQPWAAAKQKELAAHVDDPTRPEHIDSQARCLPGGVPREMFHSPSRILQFPGYVVIVYAQNHVFRTIPLDGRPHVGPHTKLWMGDSRGRWEGNTLVVDVTNLNAKGRFDMVGNFSTDAVHVVERFVFLDADSFRYEATIEDSQAFTRPWTIATRFVRSRRGQGDEYWEDACHEGERSAEAMLLRVDEPAKQTKQTQQTKP